MEMFFAGVGATIGLILLLGFIGAIRDKLEEKHYKQQRIEEVIDIITDNSAMFSMTKLHDRLIVELFKDDESLRILKKKLEEFEK